MMHHLVDQGLLDLDGPVANYWPEFAQAGKETLPVRYLLSHQAGLPAISEPLPRGSAFHWEVMTDALSKQEPWWEPGTKHGYHDSGRERQRQRPRGRAAIHPLARGGELDGVRVLSPEAIERATVEQATGPDEVMGLNLRPALGFVLTSPDAQLGPNPRAFGHSGAGGSLGFADSDAKVGFGYAMNRMIQDNTLTDPRWPPLINAVYTSL